MIDSNCSVQSLSDARLLDATHALVRKSADVEVELLLHLAEIDDRKLYLARSRPSMFAFCTDELGFSEDVAYNRIVVARAGRRWPSVVEAVRSGGIHLAGLRILVPHLTDENHARVLAQAAGKSKRQIEEIAARLSPQPPVPDAVRTINVRAHLRTPPVVGAPFFAAAGGGAALDGAGSDATVDGDGVKAAGSVRMRADEDRSVIAPLSGETFMIQFTASRALRDKLREAQGLMRHRVPDGSLAEIFGRALDLLIDQVKKERFGVERKKRRSRNGGSGGAGDGSRASSDAASAGASSAGAVSSTAAPEEARSGAEELGDEDPVRQGSAGSRHIPDAIKRMIYERDGGRCTFLDDRGVRCTETDGLTFEHEEGFACTRRHDPGRMRLLCRAHNQYAADLKYGRAKMDAARARSTRPGAGGKQRSPAPAADGGPDPGSGRGGCVPGG